MSYPTPQHLLDPALKRRDPTGTPVIFSMRPSKKIDGLSSSILAGADILASECSFRQGDGPCEQAAGISHQRSGVGPGASSLRCCTRRCRSQPVLYPAQRKSPHEKDRIFQRRTANICASFNALQFRIALPREASAFDYQIEADWQLLNTCNYRSGFCFFPGEILGEKLVTYADADEWVRRSKPAAFDGWCILRGASPASYPDFVRLCELLTRGTLHIHTTPKI